MTMTYVLEWCLLANRWCCQWYAFYCFPWFCLRLQCVWTCSLCHCFSSIFCVLYTRGLLCFRMKCAVWRCAITNTGRWWWPCLACWAAMWLSPWRGNCCWRWPRCRAHPWSLPLCGRCLKRLRLVHLPVCICPLVRYLYTFWSLAAAGW